MILDFKSGYQKNVYYFNMTISFDQDCSRFSSGDCQHNDEDYDLYIKLLGCGVSGVFLIYYHLKILINQQIIK